MDSESAVVACQDCPSLTKKAKPATEVCTICERVVCASCARAHPQTAPLA